jgi:hypothetical protein
MQEYQENVEPYISNFAEGTIETGRSRLILVDSTSSSEESVSAILRDAISPKVLFINHEILFARRCHRF